MQQAGEYIAVGTNQITGCLWADAAIIFPLPDLCIVPAGCYKACDPDTICGPDGLAAYQWFRDGTPIPGATNQCLIVSDDGIYTLEGTSTNGCTDVSEELELKFVNCSCFGLEVSLIPANNDSCCWTLGYENPFDDLFALSVSSNDTEFYIDPGTVDPSVEVTNLSSDAFTIENTTPGNPLPGGTLSDLVQICLENISNSPQTILFDWIDASGAIICSDSLVIDAIVEAVDTIFLCPNDSIILGGMSYTAPDMVTVNVPGSSGRNYVVRNPNHSPQHSIRFKITGGPGLNSGQSDVFQYTLPEQSEPRYIHAIARIGSTVIPNCAQLNTFFCPVTFDPDPWDMDRPGGTVIRNTLPLENSTVQLYPNPTNDLVYLDLQSWPSTSVQIRISDMQGRAVFEKFVSDAERIQVLQLGDQLSTGMYMMQLTNEKGQQKTLHFAIQE